MGGCSAVNCTNHCSKGVRMFKFPSDPERRKRWAINCRRSNWEPGPGAQLCIAHFEESQFENKRADNWKKLKQTAVPTIFAVPNPPKTLVSKRKRGLGLPKRDPLFHNYLKSSKEAHFEGSQLETNQADKGKMLKQTAVPDPTKPVASEHNYAKSSKETVKSTENASAVCAQVAEVIPHSTDISGHADNTIAALHSEIAALKRENASLKSKVEDQNKSILKFLSAEQIEMARLKRRSISEWSSEGIIKGLKLRLALGKQGYSFLRSTGYPTPHYSTLNRRISGIDLNYGVIEPLIALLKTKVEVMDLQDRECCMSVDEMEISADMAYDTVSCSFTGHVTLGPKDRAGNHYTVVLIRGLKNSWKQVIAHEITGPSTSGVEMKQLITNAITAVRGVGLNVRAIVSDMGSNNKALWNSLGVGVHRSIRITTFQIENSQNIHTFADVPHLLKNIRSTFLSRVIILPQKICEAENLPTKVVSSGYIKELWSLETDTEEHLRSLHHLSRNHLFPTHFNSMNVATAVQLFSIKTAAALEKAVSLSQISKDALSTAWWIRLVNEWFTIMSARHLKKSLTIKNSEKKFAFLTSVIEVFQTTEFGKGWKPIQTGVIMSTISVMNTARDLFEQGFKFLMPGRLTQDALENVFSQVRRKAGAKPTALQARRAMKLVVVSQFITDVGNANYTADSDKHLLDFSSIKKISSCTTSNLVDDNMSENMGMAHRITDAEENDIHYIAGATVNALSKRKLCSECSVSLNTVQDASQPLIPQRHTLLTEYCDMGGLKKPSSGIYKICNESEKILQIFKRPILAGEMCVDEFLIEKVRVKCSDVILPSCCDLKKKIITHYLTVRCKGITKHLIDKKSLSKSFGSASLHKKQRTE